MTTSLRLTTFLLVPPFSADEYSKLMSSLEAEDYFDIPEEPVWSSADAHLNPQTQQQVQFLVTNSRFGQANPRDKIPSKVLKSMELDRDEAATRLPDGQGEKSDSLRR